PENRMYFIGFFLADLHDTVEDEACGNTIGNTVAKRHKDSCEECGDRLSKVIPLDLLKGGNHHDSHRYQCRSSCRKGNRADKGSQECGKGKTDCHYHGGQSRPAACTDTGSALHEGGGVGGSEQRSDGGCGSIRKQCL